ncbi:hypothetical protein ABTF92_19835 [Acinetobacter baumannii]
MGDRLPNERDMAKALAVSRHALRRSAARLGISGR